MEINFDDMSFAELWNFRIQYQVSIPGLGDLLTADALRIREREKVLGGPLPESELVTAPAGKSSFTVMSKEFAEEFRVVLKDAYLTPKSRQGFEALRQDIVKMPFQSLVEFNSYRNLVGGEQLTALYEPEIDRRQLGVPMTEYIQRGGMSMGFTSTYVDELRNAMLAAVDQKEKDFINERSN